MSPNDFVRRFQSDWQAIEDLATKALAHPRAKLTGAADFPARFRQLCQQLALARTRQYPPQIVLRLNRLTLCAHQALYGARGGHWSEIKSFALEDFPLLVRRHAGPLWVAICLLYLPALTMSAAVWAQPELIYSLMDPAQVVDLEAMYELGTSTTSRTTRALLAPGLCTRCEALVTTRHAAERDGGKLEGRMAGHELEEGLGITDTGEMCGHRPEI